MGQSFFILTLGCKVNQYESDLMAVNLGQAGFVAAQDADTADIILVNTCTVTGRAAQQSRQTISGVIRNHPKARVFAVGCHAQAAPSELAAIDGLWGIVGNASKGKIASIVACPPQTAPPAPLVDCAPLDGFRLSAEGPPVTGPRARPFVRIQDGCNAHCTYCAVPGVRGPSRSAPALTVLAQLESLYKDGYSEAVLCGIHIGRYGLDLSPVTDLFSLLNEAVKRQIPRIRISSIEPDEVTDEIIGLVGSSQKICPHFHLPLQSGSDFVLRRMARPYKASDFALVVEKIAKAMPHAAIGADILVGFPGETEEDFLQTFSLVEALPLSYLHVFPFSPRKNTPAAGFDRKVPPSLAKARAAKMRQLGHEKKMAFYLSQEGRLLTACVEGPAGLGGEFFKGTTENYIPVKFADKTEPKSSSLHQGILRLSAKEGRMETLLE
ncbi:MAG: tRNA (N(6)-L-threonylcarbamoyladenosine(37)-C(2))-methylthiotransferase MtaB [Desulfatibacillaceae bacterium]|nr:tRNA (N(6)-L-threonylcarbamoyladenosine(37)-C(2))-methylthiotransferase MtaB [Desulfatibacillaceae bacterium]